MRNRLAVIESATGAHLNHVIAMKVVDWFTGKAFGCVSARNINGKQLIEIATKSLSAAASAAASDGVAVADTVGSKFAAELGLAHCSAVDLNLLSELAEDFRMLITASTTAVDVWVHDAARALAVAAGASMSTSPTDSTSVPAPPPTTALPSAAEVAAAIASAEAGLAASSLNIETILRGSKLSPPEKIRMSQQLQEAHLTDRRRMRDTQLDTVCARLDAVTKRLLELRNEAAEKKGKLGREHKHLQAELDQLTTARIELREAARVDHENLRVFWTEKLKLEADLAAAEAKYKCSDAQRAELEEKWKAEVKLRLELEQNYANSAKFDPAVQSKRIGRA